MARREADLQLRCQLLPLLLRRYASAGHDLPALLRRAGLPGDAASAREVHLPLGRFLEVSQLISVKLGEPHLGLSTALSLPRGAYGLLEFSARSAGTMREAFLRLPRYSSLLNELAHFSLEEQGPAAWFVQRVPGGREAVGAIGNEFTMAVVVRIARELSAPDWSPRRVRFAHPAPARKEALQAFFGTGDIAFDQGVNALELDAEFLARKVSTADPSLCAAIDEQLLPMVQARAEPPDFLGRVREALRAALQQGPVQVEEVAYLLGYSELRSFLRAFKRWTGQTPGEYRKRGQATFLTGRPVLPGEK